MSNQSGSVRPTVSPESMARALYAGQTKEPRQEGDYSFDRDVVWEVDPSSTRNIYNQKDTPTGEWLDGLVFVCNVEISRANLASVAYVLGWLAKEGVRGS